MDNKESKKPPINIINIYISLVIVSLLFISNIIGYSNSIYSTFDKALSPFHIAFRDYSINTKKLFTEFNNRGSIINENFELKEEISELENIKAENKNLREQNEYLKSQLDISSTEGKDFMQVELVSSANINGEDPVITIRAGKKDNISKNDVVYASKNTLLGFVSDVFNDSARVVPFFSPKLQEKVGNINIPVQNVNNPDQKGLIKGSDGKRGVIIRNILKEAQVKEGDLWVTTNDLDNLSSNLVVGEIKKVYDQNIEGFKEAELELPFEISNMRYVLVEKK